MSVRRMIDFIQGSAGLAGVVRLNCCVAAISETSAGRHDTLLRPCNVFHTDMYESSFGGWANSRSAIRATKGGVLVDCYVGLWTERNRLFHKKDVEMSRGQGQHYRHPSSFIDGWTERSLSNTFSWITACLAVNSPKSCLRRPIRSQCAPPAGARRHWRRGCPRHEAGRTATQRKDTGAAEGYGNWPTRYRKSGSPRSSTAETPTSPG